jgi:hypothetical protein
MVVWVVRDNKGDQGCALDQPVESEISRIGIWRVRCLEGGISAHSGKNEDILYYITRKNEKAERLGPNRRIHLCGIFG